LLLLLLLLSVQPCQGDCRCCLPTIWRQNTNLHIRHTTPQGVSQQAPPSCPVYDKCCTANSLCHSHHQQCGICS
jgi:hypothetical protein